MTPRGFTRRHGDFGLLGQMDFWRSEEDPPAPPLGGGGGAVDWVPMTRESNSPQESNTSTSVCERLITQN